MAKDIEIGSGTSFTSRSANNLSASGEKAEDAKVGESDVGDDKTVKRSRFKKPNVPIG